MAEASRNKARRRPARLAAIAAALTATGCTLAPLSFLEAAPPTLLLPDNHYPVRVVAVDGSMHFRMPVQVTPGPHMVVLEAMPSASARGTVQRVYAMKIEPCTRYYLLAARTSPMAADWQLVVHSTERVSGCSPEEELQKRSSLDSPSPQVALPAR